MFLTDIWLIQCFFGVNMKILVFSDSHGDISRMSEIVARNRSDTDIVIHLGDRKSDIDEVMHDYPNIAKISVVGNCDGISAYALSSSLEHTMTIEGYKFYITHGHHNDVKSGIYSLMRQAKSKNYNIVLYGHSHVAKYDKINGIHYFNPGSISYPRGCQLPSYGLINIKNNNVEFQIIEVE